MSSDPEKRRQTDVERRLARFGNVVTASLRKSRQARANAEKLERIAAWLKKRYGAMEREKPEIARESTLKAAQRDYFKNLLLEWKRRQKAALHDDEDLKKEVAAFKRSAVWRVFRYIVRRWKTAEYPRGGVRVPVGHIMRAVRKPKPKDPRPHAAKHGGRYKQAHIERALSKLTNQLHWLTITEGGRGRGKATSYLPGGYPVEINAATDRLRTAHDRWAVSENPTFDKGAKDGFS
jgi:hypothetical protein